MDGKEEINTVAFVYKWTELSSMKWYIGSRTAKGCHPDDGYICSSKTVKPLIQNNPENWVRAIIEVGEPIEMRKLEAEILMMFDAKNDPRSFNMHNGDGKFTTLGMTGKEAHNKGKPHSPETRAKMSAARRGKKRKPQSPEHRVKLSAAHKGKTLSPEHRAKMSAAKIKTIVATNLNTGEVFEINGRQEMKSLGFNSGHVSACARGASKSHKGHSFRFKDE